MARGFFVTGTDTEVGKTLVSAAVLWRWARRGLRTAAFKPVASGCRRTQAGLRNEDALRLQAMATLRLPYEQVNPYAFEPPIAPHLAAAEVGVRIDLDRLRDGIEAVQAERVLVEGVGGWRVPLNDSQDLADLAVALGFPVVLVVAVRLGCLNHALLSVESIAARGLHLAGWVANRPQPGVSRWEGQVESLRARIPAPCLGVVPPLAVPGPAQVAAHLDLDPLDRLPNEG